MTDLTSLDSPASTEAQDEFGRWPFSVRLAETIAQFRNSSGAPVLGLYGSWGSGKSSVLNFIESYLVERHKEKIIVFPFNPWICKDADSILKEFFFGLAKAAGSKLDKRFSKIGKELQKYGSGLSSMPYVGGVAKAAEYFGKNLSDDTLQAQRSRIQEIMKETDITIVVLIDDLDRMDKDEIITMLKVVRLSANFPNLVYLLAFDEERVARVAGRMYGESDDHGRQFLEKIVQHPFHLPHLTPTQLAQYTVGRVEAVADEIGITSQNETRAELLEVCRSIVSPSLKTPRQAIRYANALRFSMPMLVGECDLPTLAVVEAARILLPDLYDMLKVSFSRNTGEGGILEVYGNVRKPSHENFLTAGRFIDYLSRRTVDYKDFWSDRKYHSRYFTYVVAAEDVSNAEMDKIFALLDESNIKDLGIEIEKIAANRLSVFLNKVTERLKYHFDGSWLTKSETLASILAELPNKLSNPINYFDDQRIIKLCNLIVFLAQKQISTRRILEVGHYEMQIETSSLQNAKPLPFAVTLCKAFFDPKYAEPSQNGVGKAYDYDQSGMKEVLLKRLSAECRETPPYRKYGAFDAIRCLLNWRDLDPVACKTWAHERLETNPAEVIELLRTFRVLADYSMLKTIADPERISIAINEYFGDRLEKDEKFDEDLSLARTFVWEQKNSSEPQSTGPEPTPT